MRRNASKIESNLCCGEIRYERDCRSIADDGAHVLFFSLSTPRTHTHEHNVTTTAAEIELNETANLLRSKQNQNMTWIAKHLLTFDVRPTKRIFLLVSSTFFDRQINCNCLTIDYILPRWLFKTFASLHWNLFTNKSTKMIESSLLYCLCPPFLCFCLSAFSLRWFVGAFSFWHQNYVIYFYRLPNSEIYWISIPRGIA